MRQRQPEHDAAPSYHQIAEDPLVSLSQRRQERFIVAINVLFSSVPGTHAHGNGLFGALQARRVEKADIVPPSRPIHPHRCASWLLTVVIAPQSW